VDLRFDDGHVERWLGSASVRDEDLVPYGDLVRWGTEVSEGIRCSGTSELRSRP
jgi:hypothetical protein